MVALLSVSSLGAAFVSPGTTIGTRHSQPCMQAGSQSAPWLPLISRPSYLTDELAGDAGFDPLGLVRKIAGEDPSDYKLQRSVMWMREAELKHCRLAMLAAAGWPMAELLHGPLASVVGLPYDMDQTAGRAPSLFNGHLFEGPEGIFVGLVTLAIIKLELQTLDNVEGLTPTGYIPGDLGFDPMGLYDFYGQQSFMPGMVEMRARTDPEYYARYMRYQRKQMELAEIKNGRAAMIGITGFSVQEFVTGMPIVDQTPLPFTPIWRLTDLMV